MRAINFYKFSNPESNLSDIWVCGGGAYIRALDTAIAEMVDMKLHAASELIDNGSQIPGCNSYVQAIGVTMD
jgi:type IV pilus assembly protein PilM